MKAKDWIPLPEAARGMKMTRFGAHKYLQRLERSTGIKILRRVGIPWEVSVPALARATSDPDPIVRDLGERVEVVEGRVEALRNVGVSFRKEVRKKLDRHEQQIKASIALGNAARLAFETLLPEPSGATRSNAEQRKNTTEKEARESPGEHSPLLRLSSP